MKYAAKSFNSLTSYRGKFGAFSLAERDTALSPMHTLSNKLVVQLHHKTLTEYQGSYVSIVWAIVARIQSYIPPSR